MLIHVKFKWCFGTHDLYRPVWTICFAFETFFKISSLVFHRKKNTGWNGMRVSKLCQNVFLGQ